MEITRGARDAKVAIPSVTNVAELKSVRFRNLKSDTKIVFGEPAVPLVGDWYADTSSNDVYVFEQGSWKEIPYIAFDPTTFSITVPYTYAYYAGKFDVEWEYEVQGKTYTETHQHSVIEPLFTKTELEEFDEDFKKMTAGDIKRLERIIRALIERITGQKFELSYGVHRARSLNGNSLMMPKRVVALEGMSGQVAGIRANVESDGWIVRAVQPRVLDDLMNYTNPIFDLFASTGFSREYYDIKGEWGYRSVPEQIKMAAMMLAQTYGCREDVWRDKYVKMMKNVDWSAQFDERTFAGTGNVKVDRILESYTLNKMVVI